MEYKVSVDDFSIHQTFSSGQCFRFKEYAQNVYIGVAFGRVLKLSQDVENKILTIHDVNELEFNNNIKHFLALDEEYYDIKKIISTDEVICKAINYAPGIRILKQDLWEIIISFIISQNNNIPRIKNIIENLSNRFGEKIEYEGNYYYTFPSLEALASIKVQDLKGLSLGYRDQYIINVVNDVKNNQLNLKELTCASTADARKMLLSVKGIGGKVADCILLFGMGRYEVCPHDVWVKRIFKQSYGLEDISEKTGYKFASEKWGEYAGIAQQYLFYAFREGFKK